MSNNQLLHQQNNVDDGESKIALITGITGQVKEINTFSQQLI